MESHQCYLPYSCFLTSEGSASFCKSQSRWWCLMVPRSLGSGRQSHSTHTYTIKIIFSFCRHMRQDICLLSFCVWLLQLTRYLPVFLTLQQTIWFPPLWRNTALLCICINFLHSFVDVWSGFPSCCKQYCSKHEECRYTLWRAGFISFNNHGLPVQWCTAEICEKGRYLKCGSSLPHAHLKCWKSKELS